MSLFFLLTFLAENVDISGKFIFIILEKMLAVGIGAGILGVIFGYLIFYLRYEYKDIVTELRSHLKEANNQIQHLQEELDEYMLQNQILKEEATKLLEKNDNLNEVVSELSTYYVHIKKASEKTQELNEYLTNPDEALEEKIKKSNNKTEEEKKFF